MVAKNPLFYGKWTAKKLSATVIDDIWPEVIFFTLIATMVVLVSEKTDADLGVSNQLLTVLGLVLGLVISFRTSSAYERYQDGRKMWSNIIIASKNLAQMIWIHVPDERLDKDNLVITTPLMNVIEKKTMINLVLAFSVAVKHLLRGEPGVYYEDLYPLISFLPHYAHKNPVTEDEEELPLWHLPDGHGFIKRKSELVVIPEAEPKLGHEKEETMVEVNGSSISEISTSPVDIHSKSPNSGTLHSQVKSEYLLKPARNPPNVTVYDYFPFLRLPRWIFRVATGSIPAGGPPKKRKKIQGVEMVESHIPLEISLTLSNYSGWLMRNNLVQPAIASGITSNLFLLQDTVSNLERICNTPLPFAYQVHLRMSLWIYLALLPFQIYTAYGVITIPATAFASFLLLGFLEIGQEIENPFNYDLNDLDLDYFCGCIQRDLHEITAHVNPKLSDYIFTEKNQPFAPYDRRHAADLTKEDKQPYRILDGDPTIQPGLTSIRRTLLEGWRMANTATKNK